MDYHNKLKIIEQVERKGLSEITVIMKGITTRSRTAITKRNMFPVARKPISTLKMIPCNNVDSQRLVRGNIQNKNEYNLENNTSTGYAMNNLAKPKKWSFDLKFKASEANTDGVVTTNQKQQVLKFNNTGDNLHINLNSISKRLKTEVNVKLEESKTNINRRKIKKSCSEFYEKQEYIHNRGSTNYIKILSGNCSKYNKKNISSNKLQLANEVVDESPSKKFKLDEQFKLQEQIDEPEFLLHMDHNCSKSTEKMDFEDSESNIFSISCKKQTYDISTEYPSILNKNVSSFEDTIASTKCSLISKKSYGFPEVKNNAHFRAYMFIPKCKSPENVSFIKENIFTTKESLISWQRKKDAIPKKTSSRELPQKNLGKFDSYTLDILDPDYIEEILKYSLKNDSMYVLKRNFLRTYNPCLESRCKVLNWILKLQKHLFLSTEMFLLVTRLFDSVLSKTEVPQEMYQLIALTISWIVLKLDGVNKVSAINILKFCANSYMPQQLLEMEIKILKLFNFSIVKNEPTIFSTYYMNNLFISTEHTLKFCVSYILESFALSHLFSTFPSSELASAALHLALELLYPSQQIYERISDGLAYYRSEDVRDISDLMRIHLSKISDTAHVILEPFKKYTSIEMKQVSILLQECIRQSSSL